MAKGQTFPVGMSEERQLFSQAELVSPCFQVLCMSGGGGQQIIITYYDKTFLWDGLLKYSKGNDRQRAFCFML